MKGFVLFVTVLIALMWPGFGEAFDGHRMTRTCQSDLSSNSNAEEYQVYSSLIGSRYVQDGVKLIVIRDHTDGFLSSDIKGYLINETNASSDSIDDFVEKNGESVQLTGKMNLDVNYTYISDPELSETFNDMSGWDEFYERYPDSQGIMTLSRVGFDQDMDQALLEVGNQMYWLAGAGYIIIMEKVNGIWTVTSEIQTWIS